MSEILSSSSSSRFEKIGFDKRLSERSHLEVVIPKIGSVFKQSFLNDSRRKLLFERKYNLTSRIYKHEIALSYSRTLKNLKNLSKQNTHVKIVIPWQMNLNPHVKYFCHHFKRTNILKQINFECLCNSQFDSKWMKIIAKFFREKKLIEKIKMRIASCENFNKGCFEYLKTSLQNQKNLSILNLELKTKMNDDSFLKVCQGISRLISIISLKIAIQHGREVTDNVFNILGINLNEILWK